MRKLLGVLTITFCFSLGAAGQTAGLGAISGVVRDSSGAAVPGAKVVVSNTIKGITRELTTTDAGLFSAPALVPSEGYKVTVTMQGFGNYEAGDLMVQVGETLNLNVALKVGAVAETVEVTGALPLLDETKTGVSQVVDKLTIENLPINGRRADTFALLTPAVTDDGSFGLVSFRGIAAGNSFLTDGNDTTQSFYNENAGRTRISTQISQDAVQEFQVLSSGFTAEFGRAMGGVINTVTRSGGNNVHGTAYEYFRNRTLNAADRYAAGVNPPEWRHQFGASLGGALKKDKLFYFANFEGVKRNFPALNRIINTAFTDSGGNGILPTACVVSTAAAGPSAAQCAAATTFVTNQMNKVVPRTVSSAMGFAKLDYRPDDRNSFTIQLNAMHWRSPNGIQTQAVLTNGNAIANNANSTVETRYGKASWTWVPTNVTVNEFRFGWFKDRLGDPDNSALFPSTGPLGISLAGTTIGAATSYPRVLPSQQRFQLVDNLSWVKGAHSFKFGVDWSTTEDYQNQLTNRYGTYSFSTLTNFARDFTGNTTGQKSYTSITQTFGNPILDFSTRDINFYAQDEYRATSRLTLNLGVRYERNFLPQPSITNPNYAQTGVIHQGTMNWAPRLGLAYSINGKTVLRAGYGKFYGRIAGAVLNVLFLNNANYQTSVSVAPTLAGSLVFPSIFPNLGSLPVAAASIEFADKDFHNAYTQQGTLAIERQLSRNLGLTVSYLWTRGIGLFTVRDLNIGPLSTNSYTYSIRDAAGSTVGTYATPVYIFQNRVDTRYANIYQLENGGQSWYNGLAVQLRKRLSHGLSGSIAYTWSHAIDTGNQGGASDNLFASNSRSLYNGNFSLDKSSSGLDQRHRFVVQFTYEPKFTNSNSLAARYLINGWQLSTITTLASAHPTIATVNVASAITATTPGTPLAAGQTLASTSRLNGFFGSTRVPFYPTNSLDIDQYHRVDARLTRILPFTERVKGYLSFEAFNVFNTITNTSLSTQAFTSTAGVLTPTASLGTGSGSQGFPDGTNARRMQLALRLNF